MYAIRFKSAWAGGVKGEWKTGKQGGILEVDRATQDALCSQRQIADPLTMEEYEAYLAKKATRKKKKVTEPPKDKMVRESDTK